MKTSNWIALGALIVAVLGLIPQFYSIFAKKKRNNRTTVKKTTKAEAKPNKEKEEIEDEESMPFMLRILLFVVYAVAVFLIEIILFGVAAYFFDVSMDFETMPFIWKAIFGSLFLIPGVLLFLAIVTFVANTDD